MRRTRRPSENLKEINLSFNQQNKRKEKMNLKDEMKKEWKEKTGICFVFYRAYYFFAHVS